MSEEQKSIESIIGIDLEDLNAQLTNVWKMVWEQVILLSLYSRGQYFEIRNRTDAINFSQRLRLIHILNDLIEDKDKTQELKDQCRVIVAKVESNSGSNEILELLLDDSNDQKIRDGSTEKTAKEKIRDVIESEGIAFPPSNKTMQFSYYAMYKSLTHLIPLLQLSAHYIEPSVDRVRKLLFNYIGAVIQKHKDNSFTQQLDLTESLSDLNLTDEQYVTKHLKNLEGLMSNEDQRKSIISGFYHQLIVGNIGLNGNEILGIGSWAKKVFDFTSLKSDQETKGASDFYTLDEDEQTGQITVSFDKSKLKNIIDLGLMKPLLYDVGFQTDLLISKKEKGRNISEFEKQSDINALQTISEWYDHNNTRLLIRANQIPKLVAYLLSLDIEHNIGIYNDLIGGYNLRNRVLKYFKNPKKASERNLHVILVMKYCLYHHMSLDNLYNIFASKVQLPTLDKEKDKEKNKKIPTSEQYILVMEQLSNLQTTLSSELLSFPNELFEDWASLLSPKTEKPSSDTTNVQLYNRITNRFKRPPEHNFNGELRNYFVKGLLDNLVIEQKQQKDSINPIAYPFNSSFPLPLWVKR